MNPKISYVMITARDNHPYFNRPDLHLFQPTLHCMLTQSMQDFEWVIVDAQYHNRKDYFRNLDLPFNVKHVPAKPNIWLKHGLPGVATQYNKGLTYADGEALFFTGDSYMFTAGFMAELWNRFLEGYFPLAWYMFDNTYTDGKLKVHGDKNVDKSPVPYDILGFKGVGCGLEHRYVKLFHKRNYPAVWGLPWMWWFGCSSVSLEAMLRINGFDQRFDGDKMLMDMDVGSRLNLAGYASTFMMSRRFFLIRPLLNPVTYKLENYDAEVTIKCSKGLIGYSRFHRKYRANSYRLTDVDVEWIKQEYCGGECEMREFCKREHPWQYPFEHKEGYGHNSSKEWFNFWLKHQAVIDYGEERELRLDGDSKYCEGTFVEV